MPNGHSLERPPHALVVGGTGMLKEVSLTLARQGYLVSVIARREQRLRELERDARSFGGQIHSIPLDYQDTTALKTALRQAVRNFGDIQLAVIWIHSTAPEAPLEVAKLAGSLERPCRFFHVLGSSAADPSRPNPERRARFEGLGNIRYHEVILGFVIEGNRSRWLTNSEISRGVLKAVELGESRFIVGTVEPWSARP